MEWNVGSSGSRIMGSGIITRNTCPECDSWTLPLKKAAVQGHRRRA